MGPLAGAHASGATPTDPDEMEGLIPKHITLRSELDEWEAMNIIRGQQWAYNGRYQGDILSEDYIRKLHNRMFGKTWSWAGTFRRTEKSIGADPQQIGVLLRNLLEDVRTQVELQAYSLDEIATRLHHRLVSIHPFSNGNGRHARMFTDVFLRKQGSAPFSWAAPT